MFGRLIRFHNHKQVMVTLHLVKTGRHAVQRHLIIVPWERDNVLGGSSPLAGGRSHTHSEWLLNAFGHDSIVNHYQFVFFNNSFFCAKQEIDFRIMKRKAMHFFYSNAKSKLGGGEQTQDETRQRGEDATHINMVDIRSRLPFATSLCNSEDHIGNKWKLQISIWLVVRI